MKIIDIVYINNDLEYIYEFVEYYLNLGVDYIHIIYFRSENDNVDIYKLLDKFKENILIEEKDDYNEHSILTYYSNYYKHEYDWIMFFNCDEYLTFTKHKNIKEYLSDPMFNNYEQIQINWKIYNDNNLLYNDHRKMIERFTSCNNNYGNIHVKPIIRGKLNKDYINITPHFFYPFITCDANGNNLNRCINDNWAETWCVNPPRHEIAYIKHFITKTVDEFIRNKMFICTDKYKRSLDFFWTVNEKTPEKINFIKEKYPQLLTVNE